MKKSSSPLPPKTIDAYLLTVKPEQRAPLERLRRDIHRAAPGVEETISYGLAAFRWRGKFLVALGGAARHCAFYPGGTVAEFAPELAGYDTSKGTIRFSPDAPLPSALVRRIVQAKVRWTDAWLAERAAAKSAKRTAAQPAAVAGDSAVAATVRAAGYPLAAEWAEVRRAILGVDPAIAEGVKWNAPSYRTTEWFATVNLRARDTVQLVLHRGAKARALPAGGLQIDDPAGLLTWRGPDRCLATLGAGAALTARLPALAAVIKQWIRTV